jgi:preprotein translocase subunit SecF
MESEDNNAKGNEGSETDIKQEKVEEKTEVKEIKPEKKEKGPRKPFRILPTSAWYDKHYKKLLIIWIIIALLIVAQLIFMVVTTGDIMHKDVSLTGGTSISVYTNVTINTKELASSLKATLNQDVSIRTLTEISSGKQIAFVIETKADANQTQTALEEKLGYPLDSSNSTIESSGSNLSKSFYRQLIIALILAFIFMGITVFIIFRVPIPSLAIIQCGFFVTIGALAIANIFGIQMSTAGIAALLMLVGYSVDTDTLLTTKVIKRKGEGNLNSRIKSSFKTGIIMTLTSLVAVVIGYFIVTSPVLKQIFFVLSAGLVVDLFGTWFGNAAILKWYCKKKGLN